MEKKINWFVRILIILLSLLLASMAVYKFFFQEGDPVIDTGLISVLVLLIIVVLSESFDNFSFGKILTLQRHKKEVDRINKDLRSENSVLRDQLITVSTSVNQSQSSTNIFGVSDDALKKVFVEKATPEEIELYNNEDSTAKEERDKPRRLNRKRLENAALDQYINSQGLHEQNLIREAKLVTEFHGIDSISNIPPIYSGYLNGHDKEFFFDVRLNHIHSSVYKEKIYLMLNKVFLYKKLKNNGAKMILLLVQLDKTPEANNIKNFESYQDYFEPAIRNGLLKIIPLSFSAEAYEALFT